jgi:hypothetical protein
LTVQPDDYVSLRFSKMFDASSNHKGRACISHHDQAIAAILSAIRELMTLASSSTNCPDQAIHG